MTMPLKLIAVALSASLAACADSVSGIYHDTTPARADFVMNPDPVEGTQPWPKPR